MALQVISILSASKDYPEVDTHHLAPQLTQQRTHKHTSPSTAVASKGGSGVQLKLPAKPHPQLNKYFRLFLVELLKLFDRDRSLLEKKGSFIVR